MHVHALKWAIIKRTQDAPPLTFTRKFEGEGSAIVLRVHQLEKLPNLWGLMFGDAVYNLRCALDHLAWELAVRHFSGVEPTDRKIIKGIQFPVVLKEADWNGHIHRKHMSADDAQKLKHFQPFCSNVPGWRINPISLMLGFGGFSNVDKHRKMQLAYVVPFGLKVGSGDKPGESGPLKYIDCRPIDGNSATLPLHMNLASRVLRAGEEIARVPVIQTGPNPDLNLQAELTYLVVIGDTVPVLDILDVMVVQVDRILREFT
jgi:hypothetical protein